MVKFPCGLSGLRSAIVALALAALTACGANPQGPVAEPTTAPTSAPVAAPTIAAPYPAVAATAYPAGETLGGAANPTADPAPGINQSSGVTPGVSMPAPTPVPMEVTVVPTSAGAIPSLPSGMNVAGIPEVQAAVAVADLIKRTGTEPAAITVVSAEAVEWPDGALGCPKPDLMYPQVITPGYKLVLEVAGTRYNYHASERGDFFLCENRPGRP